VTVLLDVRNLTVTTGEQGSTRRITTGIDLTLSQGETVAIVGESGSGKSLTAKAIARVLPPGVQATGTVIFDGRDLMTLSSRAMREVRGKHLSLLLQDPFTMLNPLMRGGAHLDEMLRCHHSFASRRDLRTEVARRLEEVGISNDEVARRFPFQLSGGMAQRVALAAALAGDPEVLIADEPSTALDATTQAEILALLQRVQRWRGMGMILITHDLRLAFSVADRVYVLYAGSVLEVGEGNVIEQAPAHPYSLGLLLSEPPATRRVSRLLTMPGNVPRPDEVANCCSFSPRCRWVDARCRVAVPRLTSCGANHLTSCLRFPEIKGEMAELYRQVLESAATPAARRPGQFPLVAVSNVSKSYSNSRGSSVHALRHVEIAIYPGESVGLVGESGSGKTTLGRCLVGLQTISEGSIIIDGIAAADSAALSTTERRKLRLTIQMVFQNPYATLNPRHSVGRTLREAIAMGGGGGSAATLLDQVGLPAAYLDRFPNALSGGERQRVAIARALSVRPKVLVCDEPVSALDVSVQAQILNLLMQLRAERNLAYLFISHDLAVVRQVADYVYVLYKGEIVEQGPTEQIMRDPQHSFTRSLLAAVPGSHRNDALQHEAAALPSRERAAPTLD
jgi:peptide/nickel transport system ATP-binding protein